MTPSPGSASYFAQLSRDLMSHQEESIVLHKVAETIVEILGSAAAASVERWPVPGVPAASHTAGEPAAGLGPDGVVTVRLDTGDEVIGVLTVHAGSDGFSQDDVDLVKVYAAHATNAVLAARIAEELRSVIEVRHAIGVAQGILMQSRHLDLEQSHDLLRQHAEQQGRDVVDVAEHVVEHGRLPGETDSVR